MIRLFENGDIKTSGRQFAIEEKAVGQGVYHRLRLFAGEYFLDVSDGTPWFQSILGKAPQNVAEINLKQRILTAPGVSYIRRFEFTPDLVNRSVTVSVTVRTIDGYDAETSLHGGLI